MKYKLFLIILFGASLMAGYAQEVIPERPEEDFDIRIEYDFKKKPVPSPQETNYALIQERNNISPLPHLTIYFTILNKTEAEARIRVTTNKFKVAHSGKIKEEPVKLVMGFMEDIKERITAHEYDIIITDKKRNPINKVKLVIDKDGTFTVNGKERGKF